MRVVLPAGLVVAFVAIVVAAVLDDGRAAAPSPGASPEASDDAKLPPRIGDHWHVTYEYVVCGEPQPLAPAWTGSGVHTHDGGIMHIHPFSASEEGEGARLVKWFEYGGGLLDGDEVRLPGSAETHKNGDECPDGMIGKVQVFADDVRIQDYEDYIPQDGDHVVIVFGPERGVVQRTLTSTPAQLYLLHPMLGTETGA